MSGAPAVSRGAGLNGRAAGANWTPQIALVAVTSILVLQKTKQALLPRTQTPALWIAEVLAIGCVLVLRSGWARDGRWSAEQARLGTLANNYYEPRREALIHGFAIGLGVLGALWWGLATWGILFNGMRRGVPGRGLVDFSIGALMGAMTGGLIGAVIGLSIGHIWEGRHRRARMSRTLADD